MCFFLFMLRVVIFLNMTFRLQLSTKPFKIKLCASLYIGTSPLYKMGQCTQVCEPLKLSFVSVFTGQCPLRLVPYSSYNHPKTDAGSQSRPQVTVYFFFLVATTSMISLSRATHMAAAAHHLRQDVATSKSPSHCSCGVFCSSVDARACRPRRLRWV
jgi:hypothetical protein